MRVTVIHMTLDPARRAGHDCDEIDAGHSLDVAAPDALGTLLDRMIERGRYGAARENPSRLVNVSLDGKTRRAIDFHEGDELGEKALQPLVREKLIKIGAKVVSHGRYVTFQMAKIAVPRKLFGAILRLNDGLRQRPAPA